MVEKFFDGALASDPGTLAFAAFLARYRGATRHAYTADLRDWVGWCARHGIVPLAAQRAHVELYLRDLEENRHLALATIGRRLTTLTMFYRVAVIDGVLAANPAQHIARPRRPEESSTLGLSHLQFEAILAAGRARGPVPGALVSMLGLLGLRISEACGTDVDDLGLVHGHRVLHILGKGDKPAIVPLAPQVGRDIDRVVDGRLAGPLLRHRDGLRMDRRCADRIIKSLALSCGITHRVHPHALRHTYVTTMLDAGVPLRDVQIAARHADPRTTTKYDRARQNLDRHGNYILSAFMASHD
jgi:site-specific recombinase XerD